MKLQTARQAKNEDPLQFVDRCRGLAQKTLRKVDDPVVQRVRNKNAERMLLSSYISGLTGAAGRQVRYSNPGTLEQALYRRQNGKKNLVRVFMQILIGRLD